MFWWTFWSTLVHWYGFSQIHEITITSELQSVFAHFHCPLKEACTLWLPAALCPQFLQMQATWNLDRWHHPTRLYMMSHNIVVWDCLLSLSVLSRIVYVVHLSERHSFLLSHPVTHHVFALSSSPAYLLLLLLGLQECCSGLLYSFWWAQDFVSQE